MYACRCVHFVYSYSSNGDVFSLNSTARLSFFFSPRRPLAKSPPVYRRAAMAVDVVRIKKRTKGAVRPLVQPGFTRSFR